MFNFIKFCMLIVVVTVAGYLLLGVSLGGKTLYRHLEGIFGTEEAQTLKKEIGKKVDDATLELKEKASALAKDRIKQDLEERIRDKPSKKSPDSDDRKSLDTLISKKISKKNQQDDTSHDRAGLNRLIDTKIEENR